LIRVWQLDEHVDDTANAADCVIVHRSAIDVGKVAITNS
jgi:hypothetical protein